MSGIIINPIKICLSMTVCCLSPVHGHTEQKKSPSALLLVHNGSLFVHNVLCSRGLIK